MIERDPETGTDRLTSAILEFPSGQSTFTCSTQLVHFQRMQFLGTLGRIEIQYPINPPNDQPSQILIDDGKGPAAGLTTETFEYVRPVHDSRRPVLEGDPRERRSARAARRRHSEYGGDRSSFSLGGIGKMGAAARVLVSSDGLPRGISAKRRDAFSICFGKRELREMQLRHDWTREEIRRIYGLPLPELIFQAQLAHRRLSSCRRSATLPPALDQDRRLPGRLRVLPAKRAL